MKNKDTPSLLHYLNSSLNPVSLEISLSIEDRPNSEITDFPFLLISDSDPLTRLMEARFMTDAGSELIKVFLLVQRDHYLITKDEPLPINNQGIDEVWQKALSLLKGEGVIKTLSHQMDGRGRLLPFQPLFFCKTKQLFFPPPCPRCGSPLEQCYDEDILVPSGLQPYSTSLERYLFCPSCFLTKDSCFYIYELEDSDSPPLKDRKTLIREFGRLIEMNKEGIQFPCIECSDHSICYGPENEVLSRVVPFSFYPFYLLISKVPSLNALDFLSITSGRSSPDRPLWPLEVSHNLFPEDQVNGIKTYPSESRTENRAIHHLLIKILDQWQAGIQSEQRTPSFFQRTERNEDIPETVILSPSDTVPAASHSPQSPSNDSERRIISSIDDETLRVTPKTGKQPYQGDFLAETVILSPKKIRDKKKDGRKD